MGYKHWRTPKLKAEYEATNRLLESAKQQLKNKRLGKNQRSVLEWSKRYYSEQKEDMEKILKKRKK